MTIGHDDQCDGRNSTLARRIVSESYPYKCFVVYGLTQDGALQVAHLNQNSAKQSENLAFLRWTHHRMYDMGLYPQEAIEILRAHWQKRKGVPDHGIYMKDAGVKAAKARRLSAIARKAWATRRSKTSQ
jgi:hypothetical protein